MDRPRFLRTPGQWAALLTALVLGAALALFVDLEPRVEADFFFAADDPQVRASRGIESRFGSTPQVFVAVRSRSLESKETLRAVRDLTDALAALPGVAGARSLSHGPLDPDAVEERKPEKVLRKVRKRPFWN